MKQHQPIPDKGRPLPTGYVTSYQMHFYHHDLMHYWPNNSQAQPVLTFIVPVASLFRFTVMVRILKVMTDFVAAITTVYFSLQSP
jgi:hypothetical protein